VRRNPEHVRYVEVDRGDDFTAGLETDAVLIGLTLVIVGGLGYLLYTKSQDAANALVQAVMNAGQSGSTALGSATQAVQNALPTTPGSGVPYTPPEGGVDLDTQGGYP
jgi:hypothetical protein